ncbi:MAG: ATP-binding cassette domain-containing protein [Candidatus Omnitrophica bacterium]|nr:ATP-binding cassette domain-containing protein [Candidatus Omnitrophota bacterium]
MISLNGINKTFGNRHILKNISLDIYKGETFVIMGCSGSGKSTLLRTITGAIKPDTGKLHIKNKNILELNNHEFDKIRRDFGMLFQYSALLDSLTIEENVALPIREHTKLADEIIKIIVKLKLSLTGLKNFEHHHPSEISGGMRKRVGLARAIALDPDIVFYDEPTSGLDPIVAAVIDKLIKDLSKKLLITSVVVTHDMQSVFKIADRIAMIHQGEVIAIGTPSEIQKSNNALVQQFINGQVQGPIDFFKNTELFKI